MTHEGFEALEAAIRTLYPAPKGDTSLVTNARQADAIRRALDSVRAAKDALQSGMTPDVVLTEVEQAENASASSRAAPRARTWSRASLSASASENKSLFQ